MANVSSPAALDVRAVSKSFPGVAALTDVTLQIFAGEVVGIVGQNGAGKSTLMKTIAGAQAPETGTVTVFGTQLVGADPHRAAAAGVAMIYQELAVVPSLSAMSNVLLGQTPTRFGVVNRKAAHREFTRVAEQVGYTGTARTKAANLSTAQQQQLEIMRALASGHRLVIMDEPTASLGPEDIAKLHVIIDDLRRTGHAILYVSHDLDSVLSVCDRVTVLKDGRVVAEDVAAHWTKPSLVRAILGGVERREPVGSRRSSIQTEPFLEFASLTAGGVDVPHLTLNGGEIVGIAGLVGSGRTRMMRAIAGIDPVRTGSLRVRGEPARWRRSPWQAMALGIAMIPEDRKQQGLILTRPSGWNVAMGSFGRVTRRRPLWPATILQWARRYTAQVDFVPEKISVPAGTLSGGNQQKLLLARLIGLEARCLILDEPTRGIDVGAKQQIFETMRQLADEGRTILWSSSELDEVVQHSDRILVVSNGRLVGELPSGASVLDVLNLSYEHKSNTHDGVAS